MPEFSRTVIGLFKRAASEQGGLLSGKDPTAYNPANPIRLWIIQVGIIVSTAALLSLALKRFRQPKVIAEVLGGILLGPTAFGRIPGFTQHIFPQESRPYLSLVAEIGLCLFLFLVGLEIDANTIKRNIRLSGTVAIAGMALPFGLGAALSHPIYQQFIDSDVKFTYFMLFTGVAYSITAFPVLCRILTELKLLDTTVGIVVLSAGVANDIVGWTLLALSVALVNAGSGLEALWILLICVGWTLFLLFPVKLALRWLAKKTGSIESGPTVFFMTVTMMTLFGSAFFTDVIGVQAIFGAPFLVGLIVPREGGLTIALTEKLEDMVTILFLPLYFTLSGLSTDLGLLNNGITWGFTIAIMTLAFTGKFGGCTLAARYVAGFTWREAGTIGSLMSCKGLVELIVLNVGLSAGILSTRVFSMFVLEALVLTCMTTPLVSYLYPPKYRVRLAKSGANFSNVADDEAGITGMSKKKRSPKDERQTSQSGDGEDDEKTRFTVVLDRIEHLPGAMAAAQLINPLVYAISEKLQLGLQLNGVPNLGRNSPTPSTTSDSSSSSPQVPSSTSPIINALRLIKLTDRVSAVMKSHDNATLSHSDPLLSIFRMFALLQGINVCGDVDVIPEEEMAARVLESGERFGAEMIVVPWVVHAGYSANAGIGAEGWQSQAQSQAQTPKGGVTHNPFDAVFKSSAARTTAPTSHGSYMHSHSHYRGRSLWTLPPTTSVIHCHFVRNVFSRSDVDVGLYIDQSGLVGTPPGPLGPQTEAASHGGDLMSTMFAGVGQGRGRVQIFLPFFGGPDDRLALEFVVGLCKRNKRLRATVVRLKRVEASSAGGGGAEAKQAQGDKNEEANTITVTSNITAFPDTVYGHTGTEVRLQSETADNIIWARYASRPTTIETDSPSSGSPPNRPTPPQEQLVPTPIVPRVIFKEVASAKPLRVALDEAYALQQQSTTHRRRGATSTSAAGVGVVVVTGRSRRLAVEAHRAELKELIREDLAAADGGSGHGEASESSVVREVRKAVGEVASAFVGRGIGVGMWVLQAALDGEK
ncbi:hypothetical protein P691DRAFT_675742 [Macrolepiota fuliginosa MF-IS2]|uniref:Cation/H+ exchanger transmembrane domain-containing protein n=1 Tax=Macrolepiota fuliginosa MF-IS2 TaxID=1400762 RepID=A0A9P5X949_9AGAR|nr:hypothetical protein P691DRAFT_675742 [Macrolepiota fuliginosa MF-IS2]